MNTTIFTQQTSPFSAPASPFAASPASSVPFGVSASCPCRTVVAGGRDAIALNERSTRTAVERTTAARSRAHDISWDGNAATLFRQRLAEHGTRGRRTLDEATLTHRIAWTGGA